MSAESDPPGVPRTGSRRLRMSDDPRSLLRHLQAHAAPASSDATPTWRNVLARRLVLWDFAISAVAGVVALLARFSDDDIQVYQLLTVLFPVGFVAMVALARGYEGRYLGAGTEEFKRVADAALRYLALATFLSYGFSLNLARGYVLLAFPLAGLLVLIGRYAARQHLHWARTSGRYSHRVVVLGRERSAAEMVRQLCSQAQAGFVVVGVCIEGSSATAVEGVPVLGPASDGVLEALQRTGADTLAVAAWSPLSQQQLRELSWRLEGTGVDLVVAPSLLDVAGPRIHIRPVAGLPLLHVEQPEFTGARRLVKAAFDRVTAAVALIVLSPVLLTLAALIRATSPGPALFKQVRVGKAGSTFCIWKFRSMRVNAEAELTALIAQNEAADGLLFKMRRDPRVTPLGARLRRYSIDELPQLVNVLRGHMSLVGPRPPLPSEVEQYESHVQRRLLVKPGLTGLWQVSGRSDLSWEESVRLDLHYVENWSLPLDLSIISKTVLAVFKRDGAY